MPQDAIIRADGSGDYTTPQSWEAAEQNQNYGAPTRGLVDGFFDFGASDLVIGGTTAFPAGFTLEPFDSAEGFDGTERQLCGFTTTNSRTIRINTNSAGTIKALELYTTNTGTSGNPVSTNGNNSHTLQDCLVHTLGRKISDPNLIFNNCVVVSERVDTGYNLTGANDFNNTSIFFNNSTRGLETNAGDTITFDDTVAINPSAGGCFVTKNGITQTNTGSSDGTATTVTNLVIADNFENVDPVASGDYRIKAGSPLATNGIGAFIQTGGGLETYNFSGEIGLSLGLTGSSTKTTSVSGELTINADLDGQVSKVTSLDGVIGLTVDQDGSSSKSVDVDGELIVNADQDGQLNKASLMTGQIEMTTDLIGTFSKSTDLESHTFSGSLNSSLGLSGTFTKVSNHSGQLDHSADISGSAIKTSNLEGKLTFNTDQDGTVSKSSDLSGVLSVQTDLNGQSSKIASLIGTMGFSVGLSGNFYTDSVDLYVYTLRIDGVLVEQRFNGEVIEQRFDGQIIEQRFDGTLP